MALQRAGLRYENDNLSGFMRGVEQANSAIHSFGNSAGTVSTKVSNFGQVGIGIFRELGGVAVRAAADIVRSASDMAISMGGKALDAAGDLQVNMNLLRATSGATSEEMDKLKRLARELGADMTLPATSAADAGEAMLELSRGGLEVDKVFTAAKGTLQLMASSTLTEAEAAQITANALNSFGLSGEKASLVADMFANATRVSGVSTKDAADSFKMASAVFAAFQGPVRGSEKAMIDLTASISLLRRAGIRGSDAGTSLKQMLLQLSGPSQIAKDKMDALAIAAFSSSVSLESLSQVAFGNASERASAMSDMISASGVNLAKMGSLAYDASGKMRPLKDIIDLVAKGTRTMTQEQRDNYLTAIFGADATRAIITLMRAGPVEFDKMTEALTRQGAAADLAKARTEGFKGALDGFKSVLETIGIILAEPFLQPLEIQIRAAADALNKLPMDKWANNVSAALTKLTESTKGSSSAMESFFIVIRGLGMLAVQGFVAALPKITEMGGVLVKELSKTIVGAAPLLLEAGKYLGATLVQWVIDSTPKAVVYAAGLMRSLITELRNSIPKLQELGVEFRTSVTNWINETLPVAKLKFAELSTSAHSWVTDAMEKVVPKYFEYRNKAIDFILGSIPGITNALGNWSMAFLNWVKEASPKMLEAVSSSTVELIGMINSRVPDIVNSLSYWSIALADWVVKSTPDMLRNLGSAASGIVDEVGRRLPGIVEAFASWGDKMVNWVIDSAPGLFSELLKLNTQFLAWIADRVPGIYSQLGQWATSFVSWLGPVSGKLIVSLGVMLGDLLIWIVQNAPAILNKLGTWALAFTEWVGGQAIPALLGALYNLGVEVVNWVGKKAGDVAKDGSIGRALVDGIKQGVGGALQGLSNWLNDQWSWLVFNIKYFFGIYSPSTLMADQIGVPLIEGLKNGMSKMFGDLWNFSYQFFDDAIIKRFWELANGAWTIGQGLVNGIKQGLFDYWNTLLDDVNYLVDLLPEGVRKILGISSPSKVAIETIGKPFAEGIGVGFMQGIMDVQKSIYDMIGGLSSSQMVQPVVAGMSSSSYSTTNNSQNNYYYSPNYNSAPKSPSYDFAVMRAFGS